MDERSWVTALYILGAALTIAGAVAAYWRAHQQKKVLDELSADNQSIPEVDFVETFERAATWIDAAKTGTELPKSDLGTSATQGQAHFRS